MRDGIASPTGHMVMVKQKPKSVATSKARAVGKTKDPVSRIKSRILPRKKHVHISFNSKHKSKYQKTMTKIGHEIGTDKIRRLHGSEESNFWPFQPNGSYVDFCHLGKNRNAMKTGCLKTDVRRKRKLFSDRGQKKRHLQYGLPNRSSS